MTSINDPRSGYNAKTGKVDAQTRLANLRATSKSDAAREMEKAMGPRENPLHPMFRDHNCSYCASGEKPCKQGSPNRCEYPHARND